jgi:hypothetical protein
MRDADIDTGAPVAPRLACAGLAALFLVVLGIHRIQLDGLRFGEGAASLGWLEAALEHGGIALAISLVALVPTALIIGPPWRAAPPHTGRGKAPGSALRAPAGLHAFLATAESTYAGGDR